MGKRLDPQALGAFVAALEKGAHVIAAAEMAGAAASSFYRLRERCAAFAAAWDEAVAKSSGPMLIAGANKRKLQKRRSRRLRFTRERKEAFLAHFAATCDATASAEAAGVSPDTVSKHLGSDPAFAQGWQAALETGYRLLEAELVAQQRAAQAAYSIAPDMDAAARAKDFERSIQLLAQWRRKDGSLGRRASPKADGRQRWSFEEALEALEKKLRAFSSRSGKADGASGPGA